MFVHVHGDISEKEQHEYINHGLKKFGENLEGIDITVNDDEAILHYTIKDKPFERVRRITGYLVGTLDKWNNAKRAEESERVKHGI
nr:MAG TPA: anaerobic ribonucleoside triphosphate reductase [Caudoviricetes sp.]